MSTNPYWDEVRESVKLDGLWEGKTVGRFEFDREAGDPPVLDRNDFVHKYAWTITDPDSVNFIRNVAYYGLVDPLAGTGYWAYVLAQIDVDVVCYDLHTIDTNHWHKGMEPWVDVEQLDSTLAVVKHPDRVLLLAWPPYGEDVGLNTIAAYQGDKIVYIGEGESGCTGNAAMHQLLDEEWRKLLTHRPVQWWGLHDLITVYERKPREELAPMVSEVRDHGTLRTNPKRVDEMSGGYRSASDLVPELQDGAVDA